MERAKIFYQKAIDAGYPDAAMELASGYTFGRGNDDNGKDPDLPLSILVKGAKVGCKNCWRQAAELYASDAFGEPDQVAAFAAYSKGSEAGELESMVAMARALRVGRARSPLPRRHSPISSARARPATWKDAAPWPWRLAMAKGWSAIPYVLRRGFANF